MLGVLFFLTGENPVRLYSSVIDSFSARSFTPVVLSPKSVSLMCPSDAMSRLSGFTSRCTTPCEWQYSSAKTASAM